MKAERCGMESKELKKCPFCGKKPKFFEQGFDCNGKIFYQIRCTERKCLLPSTGNFSCELGKKEAVKVWNTRAEPMGLSTLDERKIIDAVQRYCRKTHYTLEAYHEKFGVLICFIQDVLVKNFGQPAIPSVEEIETVIKKHLGFDRVKVTARNQKFAQHAKTNEDFLIWTIFDSLAQAIHEAFEERSLDEKKFIETKP